MNTFPSNKSRPASVIDQGLSRSADGKSARCWADTGSTDRALMMSSRGCSRSSKEVGDGGAATVSATPKWSTTGGLTVKGASAVMTISKGGCERVGEEIGEECGGVGGRW